MSITEVTKISLETARNVFTPDRAGWSQTAERVTFYVGLHKKDLLFFAISVVFLTAFFSKQYHNITDVWPHQVLIANIIYPLRNSVSEDWKTSIEKTNSECYPAYKFTEDDRKELQAWVDTVPEKDSKKNQDVRIKAMKELLKGKKHLGNVPVSLLELNVFGKLSHLHSIILSQEEKIDLPEKLQKLKNLRGLTLDNFIIPENYPWDKFSKLQSIISIHCKVPSGFNLGKISICII